MWKYFILFLFSFFMGGAVGFFTSFYWLKNKIKNIGIDEEKIKDLFGDGGKSFDPNFMRRILQKGFKVNDLPNMPFSFFNNKK